MSSIDGICLDGDLFGRHGNLPSGEADGQTPAFTLQDALTNKLVNSADLLALGPVVINFFRGRWDPYCITELEAWRDLHADSERRNQRIYGRCNAERRHGLYCTAGFGFRRYL